MNKFIYCKTVILVVLFLSLSCCHVFAQANVYHPFPLKQNTSWRTDEFREDCNGPNSLCASIEYKTGGDTIIGGTKYTKIYPAPPLSGQTPFAYLREDTLNKRIYWLNHAGLLESVLYDFNLSVGDTTSTSLYEVVVSSIDSVLIGNEYHKRFNFQNGYNFPTSIIEGVGTNGGLFSFLYYSSGFEEFNILKCFVVNDTTLYEDTSYNFTTCALSVNVVNVPGSPAIKLVPNPVSVNNPLKISLPPLGNYSLFFYNYLGQQVYSQNVSNNISVNISSKFFSPGLYVVRVKRNQSFIFTTKCIVK